MDCNTTHFGNQEVPTATKQPMVNAVFDSVSNHYDLMNDLMSLGLHRFWKQISILLSGAKKNQMVCDIAAGSCDLSAKLSQRVGEKGLVTALDINGSMLMSGRDKCIDQGIVNNIAYVQANAESLPLPNDAFHIVTIGFGLRNVTNTMNALAEMARIIKPGGQCLILEFSHVKYPVLREIYDAYSFNVIPLLGKMIANDKDSYQYLVESIRKHPDQESLKQMMMQSGFDRVEIQNFLGGVVALHRGFKY